MKINSKAVLCLTGLASLTGLYGCERKGPPAPTTRTETASEKIPLINGEIPLINGEIGRMPMSYSSGMALTSGDFDGDGDLDLIVGAYDTETGNQSRGGRIYFFENDGHGNFHLKDYKK